MATSLWFYIGFTAFVLAMLALDLGVFHRKAHVVTPKEAGMWVGIWMTLALLFAAGIYVWSGANNALLFLTGYLIEQSLSVDNIFVIVMIFSYFRVPKKYEHRVLFWGILGALVMRAIFIGFGSLLIQKVSWILYVFGAFLIFTGARMSLKREDEFDEHNVILRLARRYLRVSNEYDGQHFFTVQNGKRLATPLLPVLLVVEVTDLIFAVDSIPAIFAVTTDAFLVYTSNIFAILGLRSMYFLLSGIVHRFVYLQYGLAVILVFVGLKMIAADFVHVPTPVSLGVIVLALGVSIAASLARSKRTAKMIATRKE
ncbi:MAG TPA: TerC family protein [Terriglobia bacterium]|nr:TerC family protein [Terriglobia bacterium]